MDIYLDNASTSHPKPAEVYDAVDTALRQGGSANRGGYTTGLNAARLLFEARETLASFLGVGDSARLVFTYSATDAINMALKGWVRAGDHVVTTDIEHNAVNRPLHALEKRGVRLTRVAAEPDGRLHPQAVVAAVEKDTRLVVCTHASNVLGAITPIEEIARLLKAHGIPLLVDASQTAGYADIDIEATDVAMLAAAGHKSLLGPQGTGILYVREDIALETWREGGTGTESSNFDMPAELPERLEGGTHNLPGLMGLAAGVQWLQGRGLGSLRRHKSGLTADLHRQLTALAGVRVVSAADADVQCGVVTFSIDGVDSGAIAASLAEAGIAVRGGLHCAPGAHRAAATVPWGGVRVSPGAFNTSSEIERLVQVLRDQYGGQGKQP